MIIGGIDPGLVALGFAHGEDDLLRHAGIVRGDAKMPDSERIADIADRLQGAMPLCDVLYVECMVYRPGAKVNPKILLALNLLAGSCLRLVKPSGRIVWVPPHTWKGNCEKSVHGSRIRVTLNAAERSIIDGVRPASLAHNATDAVGLYLFATGRLTPKTRSIKSA